MRLTWQEGLALDILSALLGRGSMPRLEGFEPPPSMRPVLQRALAERIVRRCLQELMLQGGGRERTVLREGQRVSGRLWDAELSLTPAFDFRFTATSTRFAEWAVRQLPALSLAWQQRTRQQDPPRTGKRQLKEVLVAAGSAPGDWLFLALVAGNLDRLVLPPELHEALLGRLHRCSPLAFLLSLGGPALPEEVDERLALLLAPSAVRLVECLDGLFVRRWGQALASAWREGATFERRWTTVATIQRRWLAQLDRHRRLDLARPLMVSLCDLVTGPLSSREDLRERVGARTGARSVHEVQQAALAMAGSLAVAEELGRLREQMIGCRYGDERYGEAQLFLRAYDELLAPRLGAVMGTLRQLRGVLG